MLGITGTPGTGKKSIAPIVAERLGAKCVNLNDLAKSSRLIEGKEGEVDAGKLRLRLERDLPRNAVVYGHLLPYVLRKEWASKVVVLRCEPAVLKERLRARGYRAEKIVENVEAELIGIISSDAYDRYGNAKTWEVDTTRSSPSEAAEAIVTMTKSSPRGAQRVDWTLDYDSGAKLRFLLSTVG